MAAAKAPLPLFFPATPLLCPSDIHETEVALPREATYTRPPVGAELCGPRRLQGPRRRRARATEAPRSAGPVAGGLLRQPEEGAADRLAGHGHRGQGRSDSAYFFRRQSA